VSCVVIMHGCVVCSAALEFGYRCFGFLRSPRCARLGLRAHDTFDHFLFFYDVIFYGGNQITNIIFLENNAVIVLLQFGSP
jgi:hypothetical protein